MTRSLLIAIFTLMQSAPLQNAVKPDALVHEIWNAWNTAPQEAKRITDWPKSLHTDVLTSFLVSTDGRTFSGRAIVAGFQGDLINGAIEGDKISFTVILHTVVNHEPVEETIYYSGEMNGDDIDLVMRWPVRYLSQTDLQLNIKARKFRHD